MTYHQNYDSSHTKTVAQEPDNVLNLTKTGRKGSRIESFAYVFDAKYRIDPGMKDPTTGMVLKEPGPTENDINTMHRYRDAIIGSNAKSLLADERLMFGAYVLFPYRDEKRYENHPFFKSIGEVNIGGLPFLPSTHSLVDDLLGTLIEESPSSAFDRAILPTNAEGRLARVHWEHRDVLLGELRNKEQLRICLEHRSYWIPMSCMDFKTEFPVRYIALYQSRKLFGTESGIRYFGEVVEDYSLARNRISESPSSKTDRYYYFRLKEWKMLPVPVAVKEDSPYRSNNHLMTLLFLLTHSEVYPELKIASEEEFRLMYELKRITRPWSIDEQGPNERRFRVNGKDIFVDKANINIAKNGAIETVVPIALLKNRPGSVFKMLQKALE